MLFAFDWHDLPHINAGLNAAATLLLILGLVLIKRRRERAHRNVMIGTLAVSTAFLACYLVYHAQLRAETGTSGMKFQGPSPIREVYLGILLTHVVLAALVPFLALRTIYLGLRDRRAQHRRLARWTFPIWLYVSVTGVVIYVLLYHVYPPQAVGHILRRTEAVAAARPLQLSVDSQCDRRAL